MSKSKKYKICSWFAGLVAVGAVVALASPAYPTYRYLIGYGAVLNFCVSLWALNRYTHHLDLERRIVIILGGFKPKPSERLRQQREAISFMRDFAALWNRTQYELGKKLENSHVLAPNQKEMEENLGQYRERCNFFLGEFGLYVKALRAAGFRHHADIMTYLIPPPVSRSST